MAENKIENAQKVKIGTLIKLFDNKNTEGIEYPYYGINKDKEFMPTVANTDGLDSSKYTKLEKGMFVFSGMQTGRDICIRIGLYNKDFPVLISPAYNTFKIIDEEKVEPTYLFMNFNRFESDRRGWFLSDSSIRSNLDWDRFCDIEIPLPSIETQRELVAVYNGLKELAEENEKLLEPLSKSCEAFIVDCKKKYPAKRLGDMIEQVDERNYHTDLFVPAGNFVASNGTYEKEAKTVRSEPIRVTKLGIESVRGISTEKTFINTKADMSGVSLTSYKIVKPNEFVYVADTSRRGEKIALALNGSNDSYLVSSIYTTFKSKNENILRPAYLYLLLSRTEFDRYSRFNSWGSARETFDWSEMCRVQIPLPPIQIQQKIVDLYNCYEECKRIANEAREKISNLCPALVQKAAHSR